MANEDRPANSRMVDSAVVAELSLCPDEVDDPEVKAELKVLEDIVLTNMIHGPCGDINLRSPCMENGRCTEGFPSGRFQKLLCNIPEKEL